MRAASHAEHLGSNYFRFDDYDIDVCDVTEKDDDDDHVDVVVTKI